MKKTVLYILAIMCAVTPVLSACDDGSETEKEPQTQICEHELIYHDATVTCTKDGQREYWECEICGSYFADESATLPLTQAELAAGKLNHKNKIHHAAVAGTCTGSGTMEYWECPDCGLNFSDEACENSVSKLTTSKTAHRWENGACSACGISYNDYFFEFEPNSDRTGYIVDWKRGAELMGQTEIILPGTYENKPVTEVAAYALANKTGITDVVVSEGIQKLNAGSLAGADIVSVSLPSTLHSITGEAFAGVASSGASSAMRPLPENLTQITVAADNAHLVAQNGVIYGTTAGKRTSVEAVAPGLTGSLTLPDTVNAIADHAFYGSKLTSVTLPDSPLGALTVGACAFKGASVTALTLPESVISIGNEALSFLELETFQVPGKINLLSDALFRYSNIDTVIVPEGVTTIGGNAFYSCEIDIIVIPKSVTKIGRDAFWAASIDYVYYGGSTSQQFEAIDGVKDTGNLDLKNAWRKYYSATDTNAGNIWHYVDGFPVAW